MRYSDTVFDISFYRITDYWGLWRNPPPRPIGLGTFTLSFSGSWKRRHWWVFYSLLDPATKFQNANLNFHEFFAQLVKQTWKCSFHKFGTSKMEWPRGEVKVICIHTYVQDFIEYQLYSFFKFPQTNPFFEKVSEFPPPSTEIITGPLPYHAVNKRN